MNENDASALPRKSLYMRIAPIVDTYDEVVKNKLETGKFPFTVTGFVKVFGMLILIAGIALFFVTPSCENTSSWYPYLFPVPIGTSLVSLLVLYIIFSSGATTTKPEVWVKIDIGVNLVFALIGISCSVATMSDCDKGEFSQIIIGIVGISGCLMSVVGCISIFLMYRFVDEHPTPPPPRKRVDPRKSVFA